MFESVNAYVELRLHPQTTWQGSRQSGLTYVLPLPALEITENSWSSYVYGGARQADIEGRRIEAERQHEQFMSTQAGAFTQGTINGMLGGAMMGGMVGGPAGMAAGAAIGAVGSLVSNVANIGQHTLYQNYLTGSYNDQMQDMLDTQHAMQADGMLLQGNGFDAVRNGVQGPAMMMMTYDSYSITQWENNIDIYGVTVSEPKSSCASLIRTGGPLRIDNLEVTGDIPNPARAYIRDAFRKGVILK